MAKYLGEQDADFNSTDNLSSDCPPARRNSRRSASESRGDDPDRDGSPGDDLDVDSDVDNQEEEELTKSEAMLFLAAQAIKVMLRVVVFVIISLFLFAFSSCYWYNLDSEIRAKIDRQKKIVEVSPDLKVKWAAFNEILLLKERHDYLRSAFPSQIVVGDQIDTGPVPKE